MTRIVVERQIQAPPETVFQIIADVRSFKKAVPHITSVEFLTSQQAGLGTRFRETRRMRGREAATELEITEFVENDRVRMDADMNGTVWSTLFTVAPRDGGTHLTMTMDAKAYKLLPRLVNPLIKGAVRKAVVEDLDAVKAFCEKGAAEEA